MQIYANQPLGMAVVKPDTHAITAELGTIQEYIEYVDDMTQGRATKDIKGGRVSRFGSPTKKSAATVGLP